ncbi:MAG TPA: hypothetical protein V6D19_17350 [Stenomitos sp.]
MTPNSNWHTLRLWPREIEQWSGLEVSDRWVGGFLWGVYRAPQRRHWQDWVERLGFRVMTLGLIFMFTLPIGLGAMRLSGSFRIMIGSMSLATLAGSVALERYRVRQARSQRTFLRLLDEIDRYHEVVDGLLVLQQLSATQALALDPDAVHLLQLTRNCLVAGLQTERIVREHQGTLSLLHTVDLAANLSLMNTLDLQSQAQDIAALLAQSIAIAERVQRELAPAIGQVKQYE